MDCVVNDASSNEEYSLGTLLEELKEKEGGVMAAYEKIQMELGESGLVYSQSTIRKWFMDNQFASLPPVDDLLWKVLERLSNDQLDRFKYHPLPPFYAVQESSEASEAQE